MGESAVRWTDSRIATTLARGGAVGARSPPSLSLLTCFCPRLMHYLSDVLLPSAFVILLPVSASLRGQLVVSPILPLSPALLPPSSLGPLRRLALPHAPRPLSLAAAITRREKYVGDQTGGVVARWSVADISAPRGKIPSRSLAVVGDGISRLRFLQ